MSLSENKKDKKKESDMTRLVEYPHTLVSATREYSYLTRPRFYNSLVHQRQLASEGFRAVVAPNDSTLYSDAWIVGGVTLFAPLEKHIQRYILLSMLDDQGNVLWSAHGGNWDFPADFGGVWLTIRIFSTGTHDDLQRVHKIQETIHLEGSNIPYSGPVSSVPPVCRVPGPLIPLTHTSVRCTNGWYHTPEVGSVCANPYTRAFVCKHIFAGNRQEDTLYFFQWLQPGEYVFALGDPQTRQYGFWSLSFYTHEGFFSKDLPQPLHSYDNKTSKHLYAVPLSTMVVFRVYAPSDVNWLPPRGSLLSTCGDQFY
jgi:hypothetical protein